MKRLYYLTTDESNACTALSLAAAVGIDLEAVGPRDLPRLEREEAEVLLDWDFVPPDERSHLLNGSAARVVGVHGFQVSDSVASFLPLRGIVVSRHLDRAFVATLAGRGSAA
jgi:hypothetical protein